MTAAEHAAEHAAQQLLFQCSSSVEPAPKGEADLMGWWESGLFEEEGRVQGRARAWITIWLSVSVPVLSEQSSVIPAISSIAVSRVTIAPCAASCREPSASVVVLRAQHAKPGSQSTQLSGLQGRCSRPPCMHVPRSRLCRAACASAWQAHARTCMRMQECTPWD
jgi:hypothetical protein